MISLLFLKRVALNPRNISTNSKFLPIFWTTFTLSVFHSGSVSPHKFPKNNSIFLTYVKINISCSQELSTLKSVTTILNKKKECWQFIFNKAESFSVPLIRPLNRCSPQMVNFHSQNWKAHGTGSISVSTLNREELSELNTI